MKEEFLQIINANRGLIFKVCNLYCYEQEDKKDLFQEILLQMWKSYSGFRGDSALSTWVYRVAINTAVTYIKKNRRTVRQSDEIIHLDIPDLLDSEDEEEKTSMLHDAINQLDAIEKSIILLYLEDKSYHEISEITGFSKTNVGVKLNRIKTKLSNIIK
ncbi:MAG: sigma-70 family RNA polymerase sigma factor [Saprospiraceae bacterium]|nr:sigma-70 family RNA polymerase sigma factor [Saprospiraceae bacterium]